ncbi:hypothetical protein JXL83_04810 [candidate division WOR-3 bacterium]|nr:hypothetical protein [candidate division WOR-3 bacterium]
MFLLKKRKPHDALSLIKATVKEAGTQWGFASPAVFRHWNMSSLKDIFDFTGSLPEYSEMDFSYPPSLGIIRINDIFSF